MQRSANQAVSKLSGIAAIGSGVLFGAAVLYLFGVLPSAGFTMTMLDDRALLLTWLVQHERLYGGLWILYFLSQAALLPVPDALARIVSDDAWGASAAKFCAKWGYAAILLAMVGLIVVYSASPLVARAYVAASLSEASATHALLLGDLFADVGKEIRLFSELLLGVWIAGTGAILLKQHRMVVVPLLMLVLGVYTVIVASIKIVDPLSPLEDTLGLFLALGYIAIGIELMRQNHITSTSRLPAILEA